MKLQAPAGKPCSRDSILSTRKQKRGTSTVEPAGVLPHKERLALLRQGWDAAARAARGLQMDQWQGDALERLRDSEEVAELWGEIQATLPGQCHFVQGQAIDALRDARRIWKTRKQRRDDARKVAGLARDLAAQVVATGMDASAFRYLRADYLEMLAVGSGLARDREEASQLRQVVSWPEMLSDLLGRFAEECEREVIRAKDGAHPMPRPSAPDAQLNCFVRQLARWFRDSFNRDYQRWLLVFAEVAFAKPIGFARIKAILRKQNW